MIGPLALTTTSSMPGTKVGTAMPRPTSMMMTTTVNKVNGMSLGTRLDIMRNQPMPERRPLQSLRTTWMRATTRARASLALAPWAWAALHAARSGTTCTAAL